MKKKSSSLQYIGKRQKSLVCQRRGSCEYFQINSIKNKNDLSHSVLAASKLKVLSRGRLVKTQADLNESPFP